MTSLVRAGLSLVRNAIFSTSVRSITVTKQLSLKEIREHKTGDNLIIEGVSVPSMRTELLVRANNVPETSTAEACTPCYMCALDLEVKHTDVLILSQFVRSDGCMLPRRITGLCTRQQKKIGRMVSMAQKAGLMINLTPAWCKKNPRKRREHKKYNTYFDETTIFKKRLPRQEDNFIRSGSIYRTSARK